MKPNKAIEIEPKEWDDYFCFSFKTDPGRHSYWYAGSTRIGTNSVVTKTRQFYCVKVYKSIDTATNVARRMMNRHGWHEIHAMRLSDAFKELERIRMKESELLGFEL